MGSFPNKMGRANPFQYIFAELAEQHFGEIKSEADRGQPDATDPGEFARFDSVQKVLTLLGSPDSLEKDPTAAEQYLSLLFTAYRFWDAGQPVATVERSAIESVLGSQPPTEPPKLPKASCYIQLPEHWFWAQIDESHPHEPVDGFFVTELQSGRVLIVLAVLGFRSDRAGFSQITVTASPSDFLHAAAESRDPPFAPVMDGGTQAGFRSIVSEGELLHLAQLALTQARL